MKDFSNAFASEKPTHANTNNTGSGDGNRPQVDWDKFRDTQLAAIGGIGKGAKLGYVSQITDLGTQTLDEAVIENDHKDFNSALWRFDEKGKDGVKATSRDSQKDPSAFMEVRKRKGVEKECLVYQPEPVKQIAISVDFPENFVDYSEFFEGSEPTPFRVIIGENGFLSRERVQVAGTRSIVAKPFNVRHVNVNRGQKGVNPHYAFAKNGVLHTMADFTNSLDANGCFHTNELGKLIGKPMMFEVDVQMNTWNGKDDGKERKALEIRVKPQGRLSGRDQKAWDDEIKPLVKDEYLGFVLFGNENDESTLKRLNGKLLNTMKMSRDFEGSVVQKELQALGKLGDNGSGNSTGTTSQAPQTQSQQSNSSPSTNAPKVDNKPVQKTTEPSLDDGWDDDIPF